MDRLAAIPLKPSQITIYLHLAVLLLSLTALWLCGLLWVWKFFISVALLGAALWWHQRQQPLSVVALGCEQAQWWVRVGEHKTGIDLVSAQLVLPWLVVLNFRIKEPREKNSVKQHTLVLWPDTASTEDLRRLRVCLRNG